MIKTGTFSWHSNIHQNELSIVTFGIMPFSITTLSIVTFLSEISTPGY